MDRHVDAVLVTGRHDGLQEINEVVEQLVCRDIFIRFKQLLDAGEAFGLPSGHDEAVGVCVGLVKEDLRVDGVDNRLVICKHGGTVVARLGKVGTCPVKDRHEVVADHLDAFLTEVLQRLDIIFDVLITGGQTDLDIVMDVDGFDTGNFQIFRFDLCLQRGDFLARPELACLSVIKGRDNADHAGNLTDLAQLDGVIAFAEPSECHFHKCFLLFMKNELYVSLLYQDIGKKSTCPGEFFKENRFFSKVRPKPVDKLRFI